MSERSLRFKKAPPNWKLYPAVLFNRKASQLDTQTILPRIAAQLEPVVIDPAHLARYRELTGSHRVANMPLAYPHVLASALHLAMLTSAAFPVKLMGLVHVRNQISQCRPLGADSVGSLRCWLEGHRDTDKGQEFDLHTEWQAADGEVPWREVSTFLARAPASPGAAARSNASNSVIAADSRAQTISFHAPAGLGRSYGWMAGDLNPIHLADVSARLFGFRSAIAHGMWSLARCAAELPVARLDSPIELAVAFKLPIMLPSALTLECCEEDSALTFTLFDSQRLKPHLMGRLSATP